MNSRVGLSTPRVQTGTLYFVALLQEELGRRIAAARHSAGLSQQALADKIGLKHAQDISRYERGLVDVPGFRIDLIAEATNRPRSYFTRDPAEPERASDDQIDRLESRIDEVVDLVQALRNELVAARAIQPTQPEDSAQDG